MQDKLLANCEIYEIKKDVLNSPIIFAGFVGAGLVGPLSVGYMIDKLGMEEIAYIVDPNTLPFRLNSCHYIGEGDGEDDEHNSNMEELFSTGMELQIPCFPQKIESVMAQLAVDLNMVLVDMHAAHERITGNRNALALGPEMTICSDCPGGYSAGTERLFVVVTEARDNTESLNLEGLVETCDASPTRGAATDPRAFLEDLAKRGDTRGAFGGLGSAGIWVEARTWQVLPRREAFLRAGLPIKQPERAGTQQDY